jgi:hypothetical protein
MKCIERSTGITRVSEDQAEKLVKSGMAKYVAKQVWKKQVRDVEKAKAKPVEVVVAVPNTAPETVIPEIPAPKKEKAKDRKKREQKKSKSN